MILYSFTPFHMNFQTISMPKVILVKKNITEKLVPWNHSYLKYVLVYVTFRLIQNTHLQSLAKTAEMACALLCIARMVSLLFPAQKLPKSAWLYALFDEEWSLLVTLLGPPTGLDCSIIVHSASWTKQSSLSQKTTELGGLMFEALLKKMKKKQGLDIYFFMFVYTLSILYLGWWSYLISFIWCRECNARLPVQGGRKVRYRLSTFSKQELL